MGTLGQAAARNGWRVLGAQLRHAHSGVEIGLARDASPVPIEIMGLMIGHVDPTDATVLVVTDTFPLPVEGSETTVVADNPDINGYMSELTDSLESVRVPRS